MADFVDLAVRHANHERLEGLAAEVVADRVGVHGKIPAEG
jgi:hypothetical protein